MRVFKGYAECRQALEDLSFPSLLSQKNGRRQATFLSLSPLSPLSFPTYRTGMEEKRVREKGKGQ